MNSDLQTIYNAFADTYELNRGAFNINHILDAFYSQLDTKQGSLLDLGCGAGEPLGRYFIDKAWSVTGVDFSERMLEFAAKYVPQMKCMHSDIMSVDFKPQQFDAITATYSLFHIPAHSHMDLFNKIYQWLKPNGKVLFTYATEQYTGQKSFNGYKTFMQQQLFYSHKTPTALYDDLKSIGFNIESDEYHSIGGETFLWLTLSR